jgi:uncharacterized protein with HEPN domain
MPSEDPAQRLDDILQNVERIKDYVRGMDQAGFIADRKTIDAVERCFERIAEAARKIGDRFDSSYPDLNLHALRQFGSALRHDYDTIQPTLLWKFTKNRLDGLEKMAQIELKKLE